MLENRLFANRTPEDLCLLCDCKKATATNSHFTPMGILKTNTGKRFREEVYTLRQDNHIDSYFGRDNLDNQNPEIKPDPHTADYIFCQSCEDMLADLLESPIMKILNDDLRKINKSQNFPITKISSAVNYKKCLKAEKLRFSLFIYSIIWRQCLQQKGFGLAEEILTFDEEETLRKALVSGLYDGIDNNKNIENCYPYTIVTSENIHQLKDEKGRLLASRSIIGPHFKKNYPPLFWANEFLLFLYTNKDNFSGVNNSFLGLPIDAYSTDLINSNTDAIKIGFIEDEAFKNFQESTWQEKVKQLYPIYKENLLDDFRHAFYLNYKSPLPDDYEIILNKEIEAGLLKTIQETLLFAPKEKFEGWVSMYFTFAGMEATYPNSKFREMWYGAILAPESIKDSKYVYNILMAKPK